VGPEEGIDVGLVGLLEGWPDGWRVGVSVGLPDGRLVGLDVIGLHVGWLVSPGRVGLDVTGTWDGLEDGALDVGLDVGAWINRAGADTIAAERTSDIEFNPGPSNNCSAP
jgi:hypothetical protein